MSLTGTDSFGPWLDTGIATAVTARANVEVEAHLSGEIDSGSKLTVSTTLPASHVPHRDKNNPR